MPSRTATLPDGGKKSFSAKDLLGGFMRSRIDSRSLRMGHCERGTSAWVPEASSFATPTRTKATGVFWHVWNFPMMTLETYWRYRTNMNQLNLSIITRQKLRVLLTVELRMATCTKETEDATWRNQRTQLLWKGRRLHAGCILARYCVPVSANNYEGCPSTKVDFLKKNRDTMGYSKKPKPESSKNKFGGPLVLWSFGPLLGPLIQGPLVLWFLCSPGPNTLKP